MYTRMCPQLEICDWATLILVRSSKGGKWHLHVTWTSSWLGGFYSTAEYRYSTCQYLPSVDHVINP